MRRLLVAATVLLVPACGLPVDDGVQSPGRVSAEDAVAPVQELPPGPIEGAGAREVVLGFLRAQTSAADDHALARQFLAPGVEWDDDAGVTVYDQTTVEVAADAGEAHVVVGVRSLAVIGSDGSYVRQSRDLEDEYRLQRDGQGELRLTQVPAGLRLTPAGAARTFDPQDVYFLRPSDTPRPADQLVPDRLFLPVAETPEQLAAALVRRLLAGPSSALDRAVVTAFPEGTALASPVAVDDGVVTVDLTDAVRAADAAGRRQLSAQLVWTLQEAVPGAPRVRLLADGAPLDVPDVDAVQDRSDWLAFDPVGSAARAAAVYVADGRLQRIDGAPARSEATDGTLSVDAVATSPSTGRLAVLTRDPTGDVLRVGPPGGPFSTALTAPVVRSASWGSGERGLWVLTDAGGGARPRLVLLPSAGGEPVDVRYDDPPGTGPLVLLRVSRDGARVAAVYGEGQDRRLWVGRVETTGGALRVTEMRRVAPNLADVADVAWESGTRLVVLARFSTADRLPVRVTVDGSEVEPVRTIGLVGQAQTVAVAPGRPLLVGSVEADGTEVLLVEDGGQFFPRPGSAPAYPG